MNRSPVILSFVFAVLFLLFYPPIYGIRDEAVYMATSYVLRHGTLDALKAAEPIATMILYHGKYNPFYPLGTGLLLIPFTLLSWRGAFLMGLCCHLLGAWLFRRICRSQGITHPLVFALYLFFPAFVLFSRTIMSDVPSLLAALLAYDAYFVKKRKCQAGIFFGLTLFFRSSNAILIFPFLAVEFLKIIQTGEKNDFKALITGYLPFVAGNWLYSWYVYGSPFLAGYSYQFTGLKSFSLANLPAGLLEYFMMLNIAYPAMLFSFFVKKEKRPVEGLLTVFLFLTVFSIYFYFQAFPVPAAKFVFGNRYLFPALPFLIMGYGNFIVGCIERFSAKIQKVLSVSMMAGLIFSSAMIHFEHQKILNKQKSYKDFIYSISKAGDVLIYDDGSAELILKIWGDRVYIPFHGVKTIDENAGLLKQKPSVFLITRQSSYSEGVMRPSDGFKDASQDLSGKYQLKPLNAPAGFRVWEITGIVAGHPGQS